jgi:TonB family protein
MDRTLLLVTSMLLVPFVHAQTGHIGGAQTSNTHVNTSDASGTSSITLKPNPSHKDRASAAISAAPLNAPANPNIPVQLPAAGLAPLILHSQPAVYPSLARSVHAKGAVVLDIVIDQNGQLESVDPIGAEDLAAACMEAIQSWKFSPYSYHGQPWKVSSSVRFTFTNPAKGTSD